MEASVCDACAIIPHFDFFYFRHTVAVVVMVENPAAKHKMTFDEQINIQISNIFFLFRLSSAELPTEEGKLLSISVCHVY